MGRRRGGKAGRTEGEHTRTTINRVKEGGTASDGSEGLAADRIKQGGISSESQWMAPNKEKGSQMREIWQEIEQHSEVKRVIISLNRVVLG